MKRPLYEILAGLADARQNCIKSDNSFWKERHEKRIQYWVDNHLPSGSGFDSGTIFDLDASSDKKLVFHTSFHHMNENGYYDGWTSHEVIVTPSLAYKINVRVTGRNRNDIKDYIGDVFDIDLERIFDDAEGVDLEEVKKALE